MSVEADVEARVETIVSFEGYSGGYDGYPVLEEIDLDVPRGAFVGVVGPSGAGKTTFLRAILGLVDTYRGVIRVHGRAVSRRRRPRVGYVPQIETVDWNFPATAEQVVLMGLAGSSGSRPWTTADERRRALALLDRLGVADCARRHLRDLSGGQQQRVFLARALIHAPDLLLLDEPTSSIDIRTRDEVLHLLADLNAGGATIILTTHELNAVAAHLPTVVCLNRRLIAVGHPWDVFTPGVLRETYGAEMAVVRQGDILLVADNTHAVRSSLARVSGGRGGIA